MTNIDRLKQLEGTIPALRDAVGAANDALVAAFGEQELIKGAVAKGMVDALRAKPGALTFAELGAEMDKAQPTEVDEALSLERK